ncbi:hypothetical protein B566_EDAN014149, partial [Ephemera danica]
MSAVEWDEVKRLAADFQRAQLSSTVQSQLIKEKLLDVIFTTDGKEYITPNQLLREIQDELYVNGGRMNLVDLAHALNVDLSHIEARSQELIRSSESGCVLVLGQLLHSSYLQQLASQINEKLQSDGTLNIGELTRQYDLPGDFLQSLVEKELGQSIQGQQDPHDPRVLFTEHFVARCRAAVRGALCAVTKPTPISNMLTVCKLSERLFFSIFDSLKEAKQISGVLAGKQGANSLFVPSIYSKCQSDWVNSFYRQNGYLEYDAVARLGITDATGFIKRHFASEKLLFLASCAVGPSLVDQVEASIEEAVATNTWLDLMPLLPSVLSEEDANQIVESVLTKNKQASQVRIMRGCMLVPGQLISGLGTVLQPLVQKRAQEAVSSGKLAQSDAEMRIQSMSTSANRGAPHHDKEEESPAGRGDKREERRKKAAGGKGGGGTQGRETKTRSTKKKQRGGKGGDVDSEEEDAGSVSSSRPSTTLQLLSVKDVTAELNSQASLADCPEELVNEIATFILPSLQQASLSAARQLAESQKQTEAQSRRQTHAELQERLSALLQSLRMFERGIKQLTSDADTQQGLTKHLVHSWLPKYSVLPLRTKLLGDLPGPLRQALTPLHKAVSAASVEDLYSAVDLALAPGACDVTMRKPDKKKERQQLLAHRMSLLEQLEQCQEPALALHLVTLLLFQAATQQPLHASGKFVSAILAFLRPSLPPDMHTTLQKYH